MRRDKPLWNLPGGRVEEGESPWDAAVREVSEEIGVDCVTTRLQGIYHKPAQDEVVFMFLTEISEGVPQLSDEVADIKYFPLDNLPENTAPLQKKRLEWYKDNREMLFMRGH